MDYYELKINESLKFKSIHRIYDVEWKPRPKLLSDFDIVYTSDHEVDVIYDSKNYTLKPNQALFGIPHHMICTPAVKEPKNGISALHFSCESFKKCTLGELTGRIPTYQSKSVFHYNLVLTSIISLENQNVKNIIETIFEELKFRKYGYESKVQLCLFELLIELHRSCVGNIIFRNSSSSYNINNRYTTKVIDYVHSHFMEKITSEDISSHMDLNYDYINRIFKKMIGFSIMNYVDRIRISKAKELIETTSLKLYEISVLVGFEDALYFSKRYKSFEGISPSTLRREMNESNKDIENKLS